ncbi:uncharacterized protein LOC113522296 [Galleria mellonella]|uniref:Uncharacterized protein LOC113522296 n=1 Tax=Galleria mellonella TaxID=7137 RepID=A0ABM3MH10_GALME|nr:uncharacterized protein LOC113522296 [Galleria mellonella]
MTVLLVFGLFVVIATAHNITFLEVPRYGDPYRDANLNCHYINEKDDPDLHSVKWYRGNHEIFRYTPGQQPPTRTFNSTAGGVTRGSCNQHSCAISVVLPKAINTRISFTCEVSTEGPRFAVVKQTKNLTVAVVLKEDPIITGMPGSVQFGEEVPLNCTTSPAMPPANIVWYVDGKAERREPWMVNHTQVSHPDEFGLRTSWRSLRVRVNTPRGYMAVRCEATQPIWPPFVRSTNATLVVARSPHLSMFTASGINPAVSQVSVLVMTVTLHIFSKYSALSEI